VFVDVNKQGLIDETKIESQINSKTKIIIPVHYAGFPCNLNQIKRIAKKYNLIVVEDACHALGAKYKESMIGDCSYSNMTVFSFHPVKHITTGEGGMITTNSKKLYHRLLSFRSHGITKDPKQCLNKPDGRWYQEMQLLGHNYRLTDIQAALGISQLKRVGQFVKKRKKIAQVYNQTFKNNKNIEIIEENKDQKSSYHLYPIRVKNQKIKLKLFNYLISKNISPQVHYIPIYLHPYYQKLGYKKRICPNAENYYKREISIPMFFSLDSKTQKFIIKCILESLNGGLNE
jgi:dTDP-4-amino-4,6-dideoxygalactose transaminase